MTSSHDRHWLIERAALGEAPPGTVLTDSEQRRLAALRADDDAIRARYPKAVVADEIRRRQRLETVRATERRRRIPWMMAPAVAVAAAIALFVPFGSPPDRVDAPEVTRLKGAALVMHRKTDDGSTLLFDGDVAVAGDRIQIGYRLERAAYAVLASVDGRGVVTLHVPSEAHVPPPRLEPGQKQLPFSYQLDDAPEFEHFFLVTSPDPYSTEAVVEAAQRLGALPAAEAARRPLDLADGLGQLDFILRKGPSR